MKDQRVIKGKFEQNGMRPNWSLILERTKCKVKKRGEEKKKKKKRKRRKEAKKGMELVWKLCVYGILCFCMDKYGLL